MQIGQSELEMERILQKIKNNKKTILWCVGATFVFGLIAHAFIFFNPSFSHDSLTAITQYADDSWKISLGRFMQPVWRMFRGYILSSWLIGFLSMTFVSFSVFIMVKTLNLQSRLSMILVAGILITNTSLTFTYATFAHEGDMFALALLFGTLAVFIMQRFRFGFLCGSVLLCISIAFYQAYITVPITLIMILIINALLDNQGYKQIFKKIIKAGTMGALGGLLYLITFKIILIITGISTSTGYNGMTNTTNLSLSQLSQMILEAYKRFYGEIFLINEKVLGVLAVSVAIILLLGIGFIIRRIKNNKVTISKMIFLVFMFLILPLGMNFIFILSPNTFHSLMAYGCFLIFVVAISLYDRYQVEKKVDKSEKLNGKLYLRGVVIVCFGVVLLNNIVFSNGIYTVKYLQTTTTLSAMTRIVDRMEQIEGFIANETQVLFVGDLHYSDQTVPTPGFDNYGSKGIGIGKAFSVTYDKTYYSYLSDMIGVPCKTATEEDKQKLLQSSEVAAMPSFPENGYCKVMDGCMVVKLSKNY